MTSSLSSSWLEFSEMPCAASWIFALLSLQILLACSMNSALLTGVNPYSFTFDILARAA